MKNARNVRFGLERVMGYYRPVEDWNIGKKSEFRDRKGFKLNTEEKIIGIGVEQYHLE